MGVRAKETSIMVTALLRQRGVRRVVTRATSDLHGRVLLAVGAHEIVNPEREMGARLAHHLANPHVVDQFALGHDMVVAEVQIPEAYVGRSLRELALRQRANITVVLIRRGGRVLSTLDPAESLESGDVLVVLGSQTAVRRFAARA
jgi:trk system potassium uptake protein TrkA